MPPRIRTRGAKALKENADVENKLKCPKNTVKPTRKVLGDKTNSLSDDNEEEIEVKKVPAKLSLAIENNARPRRQRRLPTRFKENSLLNNLSTSHNSSILETKDQSLVIVKQVHNIEENLQSKNIGTFEPEKIQEQEVLRRGKIRIAQSTKTQTKKKAISGIKENLTNEIDSERKLVKNIKDTQLKKKIKTLKSKTLEGQKKQIVSPKDKTDCTKVWILSTQTSEASNKDKTADVSQSSDTSNISKTFTPPSKKYPMVVIENLVVPRPKRIHRLPSRFEDHSISPNKFIPIQPCHASTPLLKKNSPSAKRTQVNSPTIVNINKSKGDSNKSHKNNSSNKSSPDSNNNPKRIRSVRLKVKSKTSPVKISPKNAKTGKRLLEKSLSFKMLDGNKNARNGSSKLDVYEFTFDPADEPPPQKKKRKRVVKKKPSKPKTVLFKNNYDQNLSRALAALKTVVSKNAPAKDPSSKKAQQIQHKEMNPTQTQIELNKPALKQNEIRYDAITTEVQTKIAVEDVQPMLQFKSQNINPDIKSLQPKLTSQNISAIDNVQTSVNKSIGTNKLVYESAVSVRVEDIEADFDISHHDDINYSPVNSPRPLSPNPMSVTQNFHDNRRETIERAIHNNDPLNLQGNISFFDDQPVASSSMNLSIRHPLASPWRVEFGSLPIKWQANTYLKPNMTPAVESSFISSEDNNKKKHVYVNMIPQSNDSLPQIVENNTPNLKQPSIISFMKEVAERNAKKKRGKSASPKKASVLFDDITNKISVDVRQKASKKVTNQVVTEPSNENTSNSSSNTSNDKENVRLTRKRKNKDVITKLPAKSPRKENENEVTYFGFDDSENQDQENILSRENLNKNRVRALRSRTKVLQEINGQNGPARAALPLAAKTKIASSSEAVQRMYEELKSAEDALRISDKNAQLNAGITNVDTNAHNVDINNEEAESVHLFEDIDVVHHLKPTRKSYGKAKKVTFRKHSTSDSETNAHDVVNRSLSGDEDDLADLTFTMPEINKKKTVKKKSKKVMSKKEEKEADEWAAGFNSMCEDIEEFPLLVE